MNFWHFTALIFGFVLLIVDLALAIIGWILREPFTYGSGWAGSEVIVSCTLLFIAAAALIAFGLSLIGLS